MRQFSWILACIGILVFCGCDRESVAERERSERSTALFTEAMAASARGDNISAETLYRELLLKDPTSASAHLNLALILHDLRKDYIGAVYHYQAYLSLEPTSEKAAMVKGREVSARSLLATTLAADIIKRTQQDLTLERDTLREKFSVLEQELSKLQKESTTKSETIAQLENQIVELQKLVNALKSTGDEAAGKTSASLTEAQEAIEDAKASTEGSENKLIDSIRKDAQKMIDEPDGGQAKKNEITRKAVEGQADEAKLLSTPTRGKSYVVRPGDTLSGISREAYGTSTQWRKIRDKNRSTTNPDGRLKAGETILIP
ncbi:MAG: LysM peptidoglycan-binding domain-containing protein [Kiritimatiellia bacterium]